MAISDKLSYLATTKSKIKTMLQYANSNVTDLTTFRAYSNELFQAYLNIMLNPDNLFNTLPKITTTPATSFSVNNTIEAPVKIDLYGNTEQNGTPTPDSPQEVKVVTGDNNINICGVNIWDEQWELGYYDTSGEPTSGTSNIRSKNTNPIYINPNKTYYIKCPTTTVVYICQYKTNGTFINRNSYQNATFTPNAEASYIKFSLQSAYGTTYNNDICINVSNASINGTYYPYQSQNYEINLGVENLFNTSLVVKGHIDNAGAYSDSGTSSITINGTEVEVTTTTGFRGFVSDYIEIKPNTNYKMSYNKLTSGATYFNYYNWYDENKTFINRSGTTSPSNCKYVRMFVGIYETMTFKVSNCQLEEGSKASSYTPYGQAPIEYCKIGDYQDNIFKTSGKNLFDVTEFERLLVENKRLNDSGQEVTDTSSWYSTYKILLKANTTYHIKGAFQRIYYYDASGNFLRRGDDTGTTNTSYTPTINEYIGFQIYVTSWNANKGTEQVEIGDIFTSYEPYGKDEWYIKKEIGKVVLDGSENSWSTASGNAPYKYTYDIFPTFGNNVELLSNYYECKKWNDSWSNFNYLVVASYNYKAIQFRNTNISSLADFKTWLSTHNTIVYYVLANPTYTKITTLSLVEELNALEKAYSYNNQTNITQENTDLPFILDIKLLQDIRE